MLRSIDQDLRERAARLGYVSTACPRCESLSAVCSNCSGSGRIWCEGPASLDDAGMRRLVEMHDALRLVDERGIFAPQAAPSEIHWLPRPRLVAVGGCR